MDISKIKTTALDHSPRWLFHFLRQKALKQSPLAEFDQDHPCLFVLSTGRVGTQTLAALFGLAPNVFVYHEPKPKLYGLSKLSYEYSDNKPVFIVLQEAFLTARRELLNYSLHCDRGYIETSPQSTFLAPVILKAVPNVRFLHVVRDPRDVVKSAMRRQWYMGHPADQTRVVPNPVSDFGKQWSAMDAFQKNLWLWHETNRTILQFTDTLPQERTLLVHSEDIFVNKKTTIERLFVFINTPSPSQQKIKYILGKRLNAQQKGTFPEPAEWTQKMCHELRSIAGKTAETLGYTI